MDAFNGLLTMRCVNCVDMQFHCAAVLYAVSLCMHNVPVCVRASCVRTGFSCMCNTVCAACSLFRVTYTRLLIDVIDPDYIPTKASIIHHLTMSSRRALLTSGSAAGARSTSLIVASAPKLCIVSSIFSAEALHIFSSRSLNPARLTCAPAFLICSILLQES